MEMCNVTRLLRFVEQHGRFPASVKKWHVESLQFGDLIHSNWRLGVAGQATLTEHGQAYLAEMA